MDNFRLPCNAQGFGRGRFDLIEIQANHFFTPQTGGEQQIDNGAIAPGTGMRLNSWLGLLAPFAQVKTLQAIAEILERANLVLVECAWLEWREPQFSDALRRVACGKKLRRMRMDPGTETGERGQVVIHGGVCQPIGLHVLLPGNNITFQTSGDPIMSIGVEKILQEASQVQRDFLRHCRRTNPGHRKVKIPGDPGFQTVWQGCQQTCLILLHLSGSEFIKILERFGHGFPCFSSDSLPRRDILGSYFHFLGVYMRRASQPRANCGVRNQKIQKVKWRSQNEPGENEIHEAGGFSFRRGEPPASLYSFRLTSFWDLHQC